MRNVSGDMLTHEVIKTAKTFYRSQDLDVRIGGDTAATNGKMVMLPSIPTGVDYTADEVAVVRGFVDHEAGHGRHTNFALCKRKPWKDMLKRYAHFMPIANGLEDVRIERHITQEYPGSKRNLEATSAWANNIYLKHLEEDPEIAKDIARVGAIGITWEGRRRMGYDDPTIQQCLDSLPADLRKQINEAVDMLDKAGSTSDCFKASEKLLKKWGLDFDRVEAEEKQQQQAQEEREKQEQEQQQAQEQEQRGGDDDGDEKTSEDGGEETQEDDASAPVGVETDDDKPDGDDDGEVQTQSHGLPDAPAEALDPNLDKVMTDITSRAAGSVGSYTAINRAWDNHATPTSGCEGEEWLKRCIDETRTYEQYKVVYRGIGSRLNKIRRNIERALVSTQERTWRGGYEEGQLDGRALVRGMAGQSNIYRKREDTPEMDTSVMLVLDGSGSMNGEPAQLTIQATIAMAEVFEKVGIPFAVTTFNTRAHEIHYRKRDYRNAWHGFHGRGRGHAISTYLLKPYEMPLRKAQERIASYRALTRHSDGNTDGDSLMHIYQEYVRPRPEKRKIILSLSDGEPVGTCNRTEKRRLKEVVDTISKDIEVVGLGILHDVSPYYSNNVSVSDLDELANTTMKKVAQLLLGKRFKADTREVA